MALELTPDLETDDAAASAGAVAMNEAQDFDAMETGTAEHILESALRFFERRVIDFKIDIEERRPTRFAGKGIAADDAFDPVGTALAAASATTIAAPRLGARRDLVEPPGCRRDRAQGCRRRRNGKGGDVVELA